MPCAWCRIHPSTHSQHPSTVHILNTDSDTDTGADAEVLSLAFSLSPFQFLATSATRWIRAVARKDTCFCAGAGGAAKAACICGALSNPPSAALVVGAEAPHADTDVRTHMHRQRHRRDVRPRNADRAHPDPRLCGPYRHAYVAHAHAHAHTHTHTHSQTLTHTLSTHKHSLTHTLTNVLRRCSVVWYRSG
jgi:hypothetical protein